MDYISIASYIGFLLLKFILQVKLKLNVRVAEVHFDGRSSIILTTNYFDCLWFRMALTNKEGHRTARLIGYMEILKNS